MAISVLTLGLPIDAPGFETETSLIGHGDYIDSESLVPCDALDVCDSIGACDACDSLHESTTRACRWSHLTKGLSDAGIALSANLTQFYFGTIDGGLEQTGRYGGHGDYLAKLDLGKLGIQQGLFLQLRAEHRFGRSIVEPTGALLPATLAPDLPVSGSRELFLTNFLLTQFLSERLGVYAGKLDSLDGDQNAYASGRGVTQFSNVAFVANPIALRTIPYSSLGFGFVVLDGAEPLFNFLVINPTDTTDTDGFDELFSEGVALSAELRLATRFGGRPGHQLFAGTWSSREFVTLGQDPRIVLPNVPIQRAGNSWSLYWNMDQALRVDTCDVTRHWGYFARAAIADDATNPLSYFLSAGLGGASPIREGDSFGLGYYFSGTSDEIGPILQAALGPIGDSQGIELFYRHQATPRLSLTPDFQWISQARENVADAFLLGVRANLRF